MTKNRDLPLLKTYRAQIPYPAELKAFVVQASQYGEVVGINNEGLVVEFDHTGDDYELGEKLGDLRMRLSRLWGEVPSIDRPELVHTYDMNKPFRDQPPPSPRNKPIDLDVLAETPRDSEGVKNRD